MGQKEAKAKTTTSAPADAKGKAKEKDKGKRVTPAWRKFLTRQWKRLPLKMRKFIKTPTAWIVMVGLCLVAPLFCCFTKTRNPCLSTAMVEVSRKGPQRPRRHA